MKKKLSIPALMAFCMLLLTACSEQGMHEFADAHPILMILFGLALLAAIIAAVLGIIGLALGSVLYILTFFLPFNLD